MGAMGKATLEATSSRDPGRTALPTPAGSDCSDSRRRQTQTLPRTPPPSWLPYAATSRLLLSEFR